MKKIFSIILSLSISLGLYAQTPNWAENIAPILYNNCTSCHHSGGLAPFSLMDYQDAVNNAGSMKNDVTIRKMPPWPPDHNFKELSHQRVLSDANIKTIQEWVTNGTPQGDLAKAPTKPIYNGNSVITNPDLTISIPSYTIQASTDEYRCFPIKSNLSTDMYITEMEVLPGNTKVVHHVLVFRDLSNTPFTLDAADTAAGYLNFGGTGSNSSELIGAWVPGQGLISYPKGLGIKIPAGSNIILQIHYPGGNVGQQDQTKVNFKFTTGTIRDLTISPLLNHSISLINGPLYISANTTKSFKAKYIIGADASVLGVGPHMHLIGKKIKVYGILPVTKDTLKLIKIDNWDFHWQGFYGFKKVLKIPKGTTLYADSYYDNTTNNSNNPNSPPKDVSLGEATTDEMMLVYFTFMGYQKGDENIVIDSTASATGVDGYLLESGGDKINIYPNPANNYIQINTKDIPTGNYQLQVYDITGKCVIDEKRSINNNNTFTLNTEALINGNYMLKLSSDKQVFLQKFGVGK